MKIEDKKVAGFLASILKVDPNSQKEATRVSKTSEKLSDKVEISSKRLEVERLVRRVKMIPEVRTEKVERIAEALKRNEYRIDAKRVARNILREGILNEII